MTSLYKLAIDSLKYCMFIDNLKFTVWTGDMKVAITVMNRKNYT